MATSSTCRKTMTSRHTCRNLHLRDATLILTTASALATVSQMDFLHMLMTQPLFAKFRMVFMTEGLLMDTIILALLFHRSASPLSHKTVGVASSPEQARCQSTDSG
ncbi:hypothetical protein BaRGS_00002426 [Batillaria attramentaria]|uniref:Uncharacterized protein n=1 Tax=Batillaria attramentaria TaxID=370345 RepID=A0ABD0M325_9CAEN